MNDSDIFAAFFGAIGQVGFPIALAAYLLMRYEKKLEALNETIDRLREEIHERKANENETGR